MKLKVTFLLLLIFNLISAHRANGQDERKFFIAIELNGIVCGYSEIVLSDSLINGNKHIILKQSTFASFHALGSDITQHQRFTYYIDKMTGNFTYHDSYLKQGEMEMGGAVYVEANRIRFVESSGDEIFTELPESVILPNTQFYQYLTDGATDELTWTKIIMIYDVRTGTVKEMEYTKLGEEETEFAGKKYTAIIVEEKDKVMGTTNKIWIDKKDGLRLQTEYPQKIRMYLTDASVPKRISTGNWDFNFFIETNKDIEKIRDISYMRAIVKLKATPGSNKEDLNVPGQKFTGNVSGSVIDGEFVIQHKKYNGKNAPLFPFDPGNYDFDSSYLSAEQTIESDDQEIKAMAVKLTKGSENLWDACCSISKWVADNIDGSILDGSAKETFDSGSGLCGAQSRLMTALCRAAGIPSRVVWGCMYTREYGGSFGHHGWNEVFMGDDGWIPIDVTIHEIDYVDSGHIRLGVLKTLRTVIEFEEIKILDYKSKK